MQELIDESDPKKPVVLQIFNRKVSIKSKDKVNLKQWAKSSIEVGPVQP
jgi:hypothetical protein